MTSELGIIAAHSNFNQFLNKQKFKCLLNILLPNKVFRHRIKSDT